MKQYKLSIINTVIAGILVFGIVAACITAGQSFKNNSSAPVHSEVAVLEG